jgi:cupin fold WbuC family metalloprotein
VTVFTKEMIEQAVEHSRRSPRGRIILPLQLGPNDILHRMLNALQPGSYVRPHRHLNPPKAESFVVLRGRAAFFTFRDDGTTDHSVMVTPAGPFGADIHPGVYHAVAALEPDTVVFEVKTGPYDPASDKDFAPWAPEEGTPQAAAYLKGLLALIS